MAKVQKVEGGVFIDGKFTSDIAIEDARIWANAVDPEDAKAILADMETWPGHDEAIAELQSWADEIATVLEDEE